MNRALEKFHVSSYLCSFIVLFSNNDMLKLNMRASEASELLRNSDFSLNLIQYLCILLRFL